MTDIYVPSSRDPERILAYASEGCGKTYNFLRWATITIEAGHNVWILDSDQAIGRMLEDEAFSHLPIAEWYFEDGRMRDWETTEQDDEVGLHIWQTNGWEQHKEALEAIKKARRPNDLIGIDSGTDMWTDPQSWFTEEVFGQDMGTYFLEVRKKMKDDSKKLETFDGWTDWQVINAQYFTNVQEILKKPGCHLYVTAEADKLKTNAGKASDDKKTIGTYGDVGLKPKGQKSMGFKVMTVMYLDKQRDGTRLMTTVKDRSRELLDEEEYEDFVEDYLVKVAGWHKQGSSSGTARRRRSTSTETQTETTSTPQRRRRRTTT